LRSNSSEEEADPVSPFGDEEKDSGGEPDWLDSLRISDAFAPAVQPFENSGEEATSNSEDDVPDWLRPVRRRAVDDGLKNEPPLGVPNFDAAEPQAPDQDWLSRLGEIQPDTSGKAQELPSESAAYESDMPDWLAKISELKANEPEPDAFPDWLEEISLPAEGNTGASSTRQPEPPIDTAPIEPKETNQPVELPTSVIPAESVTDKPPAPPPGEEKPTVEPQGAQWEADWVPDWLAELEAKAPSGSQGNFEPSAPLILGDAKGDTPPGSRAEKLPDWLEQPGMSRSSPTKDEQPGEQEVPEEPIIPADLPSWVQAMRPMENVAPVTPVESESDPRIEEQGPLAGLRGILPSESTASDFRQPARYTTLLEVSERERDHSEMFEKLLATEADPEPAAPQALLSSSRILRLVLALVLFAVVLYPIAAHTHIVPIPQAMPQEAIWANETIDSLSTNDPVLLVIDYSPSLAGELEAASAGVVDHLMVRGTRLAVISSAPTGPALATRLLKSLYSQPESYMDGYIRGEKIVDLGYLPGGTAGLASFARQPKEAAYYDPIGQPAWDHPALQGVTSLRDFAQIVLLTDNVDTARGWLEQVRPHMNENGTFVVVSSAQAAPVLRAYLDSGQVQGMVAGLTGGAAYDQMHQRSGAGSTYWDAYQAGTWAAIIMILGGALFNAVRPLWKDRKTSKEVAA
jgi:hypothetical protein